MSTETLGAHGEGRVRHPPDEDPEDPLFAIAYAIEKLADAMAEIARHLAMQRIEAREAKRQDG